MTNSIINAHRLLSGPRCDPAGVARVEAIIQQSHTERQTTLLVRANGHLYDARWTVSQLGLEEIVLAYLGRPATGAALPAATGAPVAS